MTTEIPILGVQIDVNDAGVISGISLSAVLFVLAASLRREEANLHVGIARAIEGKKENLDLLAMAQVLSFASTGKGKEHRSEHAALELGVYCIIAIPSVALGFLCYDDFIDSVASHRPSSIGDNLIGASQNLIQLGYEKVAVICAVGLTVLCLLAKIQLNGQFSVLNAAIAGKPIPDLPFTRLKNWCTRVYARVRELITQGVIQRFQRLRDPAKTPPSEKTPPPESSTRPEDE